MKEITNQRVLWGIIDKYLDAHIKIRNKYITQSAYENNESCLLCILDGIYDINCKACEYCTYNKPFDCSIIIGNLQPIMPTDDLIYVIPIQYLKIIYHNEMIFYLCSIKFQVNSLKEFIEKAKVRSNKVFDELNELFK